MADNSSPALNPVLKLSLEPVPDNIEARGKSEETTKIDRLERQQNKLEWDLRGIEEGVEDEIIHGGDRLLLHVRMFSDSLAPTHKPHDVFPPTLDCRFVAPMFDGYLVEVCSTKLSEIADLIAQAPRWPIRSDISRIQSITTFGTPNVLGKNSVEGL